MVNPGLLFGRLGNRMFQMAYIYAQMKREEIPDIYLQDEKYFKEYADEIKVLYGAEIGVKDYVAVHVRRGDYVGNSFYTDLTNTEYYEKAFREFPVDTKFLIFSDDIAWCEDYFIGNEYFFDYSKTDVDALNEMASCRGHIIANSSFSWWGAYLSPHGEKVVAPKNWFTDGVKRVGMPDNWVQL